MQKNKCLSVGCKSIAGILFGVLSLVGCGVPATNSGAVDPLMVVTSTPELLSTTPSPMSEMTGGIVGRITHPDGTPIVGARIIPKPISLDDPNAPIKSRGAATNDKGEYRVGYPPGTYDLQIYSRAGEVIATQRVVVKLHERVTVDIVIPSLGITSTP